jgi:hypothetical protein
MYEGYSFPKFLSPVFMKFTFLRGNPGFPVVVIALQKDFKLPGNSRGTYSAETSASDLKREKQTPILTSGDGI